MANGIQPGMMPTYNTEKLAAMQSRILRDMGGEALADFRAELDRLLKELPYPDVLAKIRTFERWFPPIVPAMDLSELSPTAPEKAKRRQRFRRKKPGTAENALETGVSTNPAELSSPIALKKPPEAPPADESTETTTESKTIRTLKWRMKKEGRSSPLQPADLWPDLPDSTAVIRDVEWVYNNYADMVEIAFGGIATVWWEAARTPPPSRGALTQMNALVLDRKGYMSSNGTMNRVLLKLDNQETEQVKNEKKKLEEIEDLLKRMAEGFEGSL